MILSRRSLLTGSLATAAAAVAPSLPLALPMPLPPGEYTVVVDSLTTFGQTLQARNAAKAMLHGINYGLSNRRGKYMWHSTPPGTEVLNNLDADRAELIFMRLAGVQVGLRRVGDRVNQTSAGRSGQNSDTSENRGVTAL